MSGLQRKKPLGRGVPLQPGGPLARLVPLGRGEARLTAVTPLQRGTGLQRSEPINPVSVGRRRENRERAKMADRRWPDRRDGAVLCAVWEATQPDWCDRLASDLHEIVRRAQGGSIVADENTIPVCRPCNGLLADGPRWGYLIGVIKHDALCCQGRPVCAQYVTPEEAA